MDESEQQQEVQRGVSSCVCLWLICSDLQLRALRDSTENWTDLIEHGQMLYTDSHCGNRYIVIYSNYIVLNNYSLFLKYLLL